MLSDFQAALGTTFAAQLVRAWNRSSEFMSRLTVRPGGGQGGGQHVGWNVKFKGATATSFAEGSDIDPGEFSKDVTRPASLGWGQYRSAFELSNLEMNVAANNMGNATELENVLEDRLFDAICEITSEMNKDLIVGDGTSTVGSHPTIVGILTALANSGTYATIDPGTYTAWAGNVQANGGIGRPLTLDLLSKAEQSQFLTSARSAELLLTTAGICTRYEGLFSAVQRVNAGAAGPIPRFDASTEQLYWRGKPLVRDKDMSAGIIAGLVMSELELRLLPWAPVNDMVPMTVAQLVSSDGKNNKSLGAFVKVYPLGRTGSGVKFVAEIYAQLKVPDRRSHFLVKDVNES